MKDYVTKAVVLEREPIGEADSRVVLFTEQFGKVVARAKGARKITSKLSAHLEPLSLITARLVFSKSIQVADSLKVSSFKLNVESIEVANLISETVSNQHPDGHLWELISRGRFSGRGILTALGFDLAHAKCEVCHRPKPERFVIKQASYVCIKCLPKFLSRKEYYNVI